MMRAIRIVLLGGLAAGLVAAGQAEARTERLRWTHPDPGGVDRYTIYIGSSSGSYTQQQDVVAPPNDGQAFYTDIQVADDATVYVAVSATGPGGEGPLSNELQRDPPPPPDGGGGGGTPPAASAGILRFVLWDADTEVILDEDLQSDELTLDVATQPCATIQVIVNDYLEQVDSPGSVRFAVNGIVPECTVPGVTHDDERPYVLGADSTAQDFACSELLSTPGPYVLEATPFDGDGCTGAQGTPRIVRFTVIDSSGGSGTQEPLGQPGRPTLVPF